MIVPLRTSPPDTVDYPDDDGNPMAENTLQFQWIMTLQGGLDDLFRNDPDVFVAGDLLWYAVEGDNTLRAAPDAMVVFGRPKGYRGSYQQWNENGVAPQVVFEVLSPGNRAGEMARKRQFYESYGVEEYYIYDPDDVELSGFIRNPSGHFDPITEMNGFISPRLGIQFDMNGAELVIRRLLGQLLLDDVGLNGDAQVIRLTREIGRDVIVHPARLECGIPQIAPEHGGEPQLVRHGERGGDLDDLACGFRRSEVDSRSDGGGAHLARFAHRAEHHLIEPVGVREQFVVIQLHDERNAVRVPPRDHTEHAEG